MEKENEENQHNHDNPGHDHQKKNPRSIIQIPSYKELIESSQQPSQPSSLFKPSKSFSQAFSYLKSSEFYTPPPSSSSSSSSSLHTSKTLNAVVSRQIGQPDAPSSSSSATPAAASAALSVSSASAFSPSPSPHSVQSQNAILVSHRQKGNPLLKHIRNVRWNFADVVCDYLLGQNSCAIYISLRYHLLHPDYLYYRIRELQKNFKLRIVLCHVDVEDVVKPLLEVTRTALLHDCTLLCGWSLEECGRYLETIKVYENKPADLIQGQMDTDYLSRISHALTAVRHVNKTDVVTLGSTFGSLSHIMDASMEDLARCPGIGERKVKRLYDTFHEPFKRVVPSRPAVPESSVQKNADPCSKNEVPDIEKEEGDASKQQKKNPELTVKSALSAALAKYADKVGKKTNKSDKGDKKTNKSSTKIGEGTGDCVEAKSENSNSSKVAAS